MSHNAFQTVKQQAEIALTYLLTLVDGTQHWLIPVDALNGVVMDDPNDRGLMTGRLYGGGSIQVPIDHIFMVEEKPYRMSWFDGQKTRSERCSEKEVERRIDQNTDKNTGEVKNIRRIEDTRNPDNRVDKDKKSLW